MDYETEEQQVEALKRWWAENGRSVILGVVIGAGAIVGWQGWGKYQQSQSQQASDVFSETLDALNAESDPAGGDSADLLAKAEALKSDHAGSLYAAMASLAAARSLVAAGDLDGAAAQLKWTIDKADQKEVRTIAKIRLARLMGAAGKADEALSMLPDDAAEVFTGLIEEVRGDLYFAQDDLVKAREAYKKALDSGQRTGNPNALTMKLNDLNTSVEESS